MILVVGLGNKGKKYEHTRHNLGFMALDLLATDNAFVWRDQCQAKVATAAFAGHTELFAKPQTLMNLSGTSVAALMSYYKIPPDSLIVIHDELDLPLGEMKIKHGGSAAGHHGVKSIINALGTNAFTRIRIGMGTLDKENKIDAEVYVLEKFNQEESNLVAAALPKAIEKLLTIVSGLNTSSNAANKS